MISDFEWEALPIASKELIKAEAKSACVSLFADLTTQFEDLFSSFGISRRELFKIIIEYAIERI